MRFRRYAEHAPSMPRESGTLVSLGRTVRIALAWAWEASPSSVVMVVALTALTALRTPAQLALTQQLVDGIGNAAVRGGDDMRPLLPAVAAMSALAVLGRVLDVFVSTRQTLLGDRVTYVAERRFYAKTVEVDLVNFDDPEWYDLYQRSVTTLTYRPTQVITGLASLLGSAVTLTGVMGVLLSLHPLLAVLALLSVLPDVVSQRGSVKLWYADQRLHAKDERDIYFTKQTISQPTFAAEIRSYGAEPWLLERFNRLSLARISRRVRLLTRVGRMQFASGAASGLILAACYGFLAQRGAEGDLTPGAAAVLVGSLASITASVGALSRQLVQIEEHATFLRDVLAFFNVPRSLKHSASPKKVPEPNDDGIRFEGVHFAYPIGGVQALEGLDLHIRAGEMLALVGDNGAGKTTIVKLLQRFYDPDQGRITFGGVDLRDLAVEDLRSRIGCLLQDFARYQLTVRENITIGRCDREGGDDAVQRALEAARATAILETLPEGLASRVGHQFGGHELSGGQWQRLALARLIYRDAEVWVLDEPTSAMDPEAEAAIFAELREQLHERIGIVISHRFSTVRIADRIAVLSGGRVTELGTHDELLARGGRYAELFELQAAGYR